MRRSIRYLTSSIALLAASSFAHAEELPHVDAYQKNADMAQLSASSRAALEQTLGYVSSIDTKRGVPRFFWAPRNGLHVPASLATSPERTARFYLERYASIYGVGSEALKAVVVAHTHDLGRGAIIVTFRQRVDGIDLIRNDVKVVMNRNNDLIAITGNLHPSATPGNKRSKVFKQTPAQVVARAFNELYGTSVPATAIFDTKQKKGDYGYFDLSGTLETEALDLGFTSPARVKKVYFPMPDRIVPAYFVELTSGRMSENTSDAYSYIFAADDGRLLYRQNLTESAAFKYRVWTDSTAPYTPISGPQADFTPHPTGMPDGSSPAYIPPIDVTVDGFNTNPNNTFDPWLPAGATNTNGNNVDAYADHSGPDGFSAGDFRASTTAPGEFLRTYDTAADPLVNQGQSMASVAHLFYVNNWLHDFYYDSGFNEAAGNAQQNNFGRGGQAGDPLRAEAQDSPSTQKNNANMQTLGDGTSPRMQMYIWDGADTRTLNVNPVNPTMKSNSAGFGPQSFNIPATAVAEAFDGTAPTTDGCETISTNLTGKIAIIDRGTCTFAVKVKNAQLKGAVGVLIANNVAGDPPPAMGGTDNTITIPALSITMEDGAAIRSAIMNGAVTAAMFRQPGMMRDGTIDNDIVSHEWGHYYHHRLVSCGSNMCGAMSEGWGDWVALHMALRANDNLNGTYAMAAYATAVLGDSGYFGIRRYPYSTDMTKSPLTYKHMTTGVALPAGVPIQPAAQDNAEVHNAGEIWTLFLFESYLKILGETKGSNPRYTFEQARRVMADYVTGGMKATPTEPTFIEQRDAIFAVAAASEPLDFMLLAQGFAKRGMGTCAETPPTSSTTFSGIVEDFNVRPKGEIANPTTAIEVDDSITSCDNDGILDAGESGKVYVSLRNTGAAPLTGATATISSTTPGVSFPNGTTITFPTIQPFTDGVGTVDIALAQSAPSKLAYALTVNANTPGACNTTLSATRNGMFSFDNVINASANDDVESEVVLWTPTDGAGMPSTGWSRIVDVSPNHLWHGNDDEGIHDYRLESPPLQVGTTSPFVMVFDHRYSFERSMGTNWDGSVIEISEDNGMTWNDISQYGTPGYGGVIGDPAAGNPLEGRQGFVGTSAGHPAFQNKIINMGTTLAGKTVKVRFRIGSDEAVGDEGWDIDNLQFQGILNKPFAQTLDENGQCAANGPPVANAGADQSVFSGDMVTLDGTASTDPDNDPLTYTWTQVAGPAVMLSSMTASQPTFTAPNVMMDTVLTFQVTVSDGVNTSVDTVTIIVKPSSASTSSSTGVGGAGGTMSTGVTTGVGGAGGTMSTGVTTGVGGAGGTMSTGVTTGVGGSMGSTTGAGGSMGVGGSTGSTTGAGGSMGVGGGAGVGGAGGGAGVGGAGGSAGVGGAGGSAGVGGNAGTGGTSTTTSSTTGVGGNAGTGGTGTGGNIPKGGDPTDDGGCGCSVAGEETPDMRLAPFAALAAAALFRRRRQGKGRR